MPNCREVARSIAADDLATAGWRKRWSIRLHLMMCRHCRRYSSQIEAIGAATRRIFGNQAPEPDSRERLRLRILDRVSPDRPEPGDDASDAADQGA